MQVNKWLNPSQEWPMYGEHDYQTCFSERLLRFANTRDIIAHKILHSTPDDCILPLSGFILFLKSIWGSPLSLQKS